MNARIFLSINFIALAIVLVLLPPNESIGDQLKPGQMLDRFIKTPFGIDVDIAARYLNENDSSIQFIDLRPPNEYSASTIPGSINIPYNNLLKKEWQGYLNQTIKINILYGTDDIRSNLALALLNSKGYKNNQVLNGGLNEWNTVVMNSEFKGGRLTARENAVYENRHKARLLFTEINSLPDSLKNKFLEVKFLEEEQLDGGCE